MYESILYGFAGALGGVTGNLIQAAGGVVISSILVLALARVNGLKGYLDELYKRWVWNAYAQMGVGSQRIRHSQMGRPAHHWPLYGSGNRPYEPVFKELCLGGNNSSYDKQLCKAQSYARSVQKEVLTHTHCLPHNDKHVKIRPEHSHNSNHNPPTWQRGRGALDVWVVCGKSAQGVCVHQWQSEHSYKSNPWSGGQQSGQNERPCHSDSGQCKHSKSAHRGYIVYKTQRKYRKQLKNEKFLNFFKIRYRQTEKNVL